MTVKTPGTCYVLLSGGLDSTVCLAHAIKTFEKVVALSVDYAQRHKDRELASAIDIAQYYGVLQVRLQLVLGVGGLTDTKQVIPQVGYSALSGVSPSYVPFRNGTLLSNATSVAQADPNAIGVMYGAHAEDAANWAYPDCTPEFIGAMSAAIYIGTYHRIRLYTPLMWMSKVDVVTWGTRMQTPLNLTWSCYEGGDLHCGVCPTCRARKDAFAIARIKDYTAYVQ